MAMTLASIRPVKYEPKKIEIPYASKVRIWEPKKTMGMIFCQMGTGKTTLLKNLTKSGLKVLIIDSDMGGTISHNVCAETSESWEDLCNIIFSIPEKIFDIVAIDTIDTVAIQLRTHVLASLKVAHPSIIPHGSGWDYENGLIIEQIGNLAKKGSHVIFLGHSKIADFKNEKDETIKVRKPTLRGSLFHKIGGLCAYVMCVDMYGTKRVIHTQKSEAYEVKDRTGKFKDREELPLDGGEVLNAYLRGFNKI